MVECLTAGVQNEPPVIYQSILARAISLYAAFDDEQKLEFFCQTCTQMGWVTPGVQSPFATRQRIANESMRDLQVAMKTVNPQLLDTATPVVNNAGTASFSMDPVTLPFVHSGHVLAGDAAGQLLVNIHDLLEEGATDTLE